MISADAIKLKKLFISIFYLLMLVGLSTDISFAREADLPVFDMGEIVVWGESDEEEGSTTITEITAKEIEQRNAKDLGEVLELIPGLYYHHGRTKNEYYVSLRGFGQEHVMILLDGVPVYVPYEGLVNLQDIPVQNIAKVKVIKGGASALYGSNTMGGVINIITKSGTEKPSLNLTYSGGENATHHVDLTHGWKLGNFSYSIGGSHRESDGTILAEDFELPADVLSSMAVAPANPSEIPNVPIAKDSDLRDGSDYSRDSLMLSGKLDFSEAHRLGLSVVYYKHEYGIPPTPIFREHKKGFYWFPRYWRFSDWQRMTVEMIQESRFSDTLRLKARLFHDSYDNVLDSYDDATYTGQFREGPPSGRSEFDDYDAGGNLYVFYNAVPDNELRLGLTFRRDVHRETFASGPLDRLSSDTYSVAIEDSHVLNDKISVVAGIGYDMFDKLERKQFDNPDGSVGNDVDSFNGNVGISLKPSDKWEMYASIARKIRFPTMRNLYSTGVVGPSGNPDLEEESSVNYEVGSKWQLADKVIFSAAVFYSDIKNLIQFDNLIGRFEQYRDAMISGVEFELAGDLTTQVSGAIGYTYLTTESDSVVTIENSYFESLTYTPDELSYRPNHKIDFSLLWNSSFGLDASVNGSYIGEQIYYYHADPDNNTRMISDKRTLDSYMLVNARISQDIGDNFTLFIACENLLNEEYQEIALFPGQGRTLWGGLKIRL